MAISRIFDLSTRSMATYQRALDITSHNIANSSNPDFSRQKVVFATENPEVVGGFVWGSGIKLDSITRVRNNLIDSQLRVNNQSYNDNNQRSALLGQVEQLFTEPSDLGLSNLMTNFFSSWQTLAVTPNSIPLRSNVVNAAQQISSKVQSITDGLNTARTDVLNDAKSRIDTLNNDIAQVQSLNKQIFEAAAVGNDSGDLLDNRDKVLDELSKLVNVNISYDSSNSAVVSIGGVFAADRTSSVKFSLANVNGNLTLTSEGGANVQLSGGEINALVDVYSNYIPQYQSKVDNLITTLVDAVNGEHAKGTTISDPPKTGINFFDNYKSGELKVSQKIIDDPRLIAVSEDGTDGNGDIATSIGELATKKLIDGATLGDSYSSFISTVGTDVQKATQISDSTKMVVQQLENQRASYSGVSIDEEMANVIKFQKSYEASAKLIKIANDMLDTLLAMV